MDFPRSARSSPTRHNRNHHLDFGDGGAAHFERSALRRSLELAAKRCYGNRAHFLQNGFRFGYPQIDWAGNAPGYVGTEFPILPFIAAVCYKLAGVHEWIGRIQAVILFAVSVPFFFLLVREIFASTAVVWATFFYSFAPLNIFAGRSFMPDVPSLSFAIVGLYFFVRWVEHRKSLPLFFAAVAIAVSLLIRITNIIVLVPLAYLVVAGGGDPGSDEALIARAGRRQRRRLQLAFFAAITLLPPAIWYWHAHQIVQEFYPIIASAPAGLESNLSGGTGRLRNKIWYPVSRRLFQR